MESSIFFSIDKDTRKIKSSGRELDLGDNFSSTIIATVKGEKTTKSIAKQVMKCNLKEPLIDSYGLLICF